MKATSTSSTSATTQTLERITVSTAKMPASSAYVSPTLGALEQICSIGERERSHTINSGKLWHLKAIILPSRACFLPACEGVSLL